MPAQTRQRTHSNGLPLKKKGIAICRDGKDRGATRAPAVQRDDCANKRNNRRREGGGTRRFEGGAGEGTRRRSTENATSQRTPRILGFGFSVVQAYAEGEEKDQPSAGSTHRIDSLEIPIGFDREGQNRKEEWRRASGLVCVRANHGTTTEGVCGDLGNVPTDRERWHTRATGGKICPGVVHHPPQPTTVGGGDARDGRGGTASAVAGRRGGGGGHPRPRDHHPRHRESSAVCSWFLVAPPPSSLIALCVCVYVCVCV